MVLLVGRCVEALSPTRDAAASAINSVLDGHKFAATKVTAALTHDFDGLSGIEV